MSHNFSSFLFFSSDRTKAFPVSKTKSQLNLLHLFQIRNNLIFTVKNNIERLIQRITPQSKQEEQREKSSIDKLAQEQYIQECACLIKRKHKTREESRLVCTPEANTLAHIGKRYIQVVSQQITPIKSKDAYTQTYGHTYSLSYTLTGTKSHTYQGFRQDLFLASPVSDFARFCQTNLKLTSRCLKNSNIMQLI